MITKERLLAISNLNLKGKVESMDDDQMEQYEQTLISFIENFPEEEGKIKAALEGKDASLLADNLAVMCEELEKIHADGIAAECRKQISAMKINPFEKIEAYVSYFLKSTATLSIDIQMAKYLENDRHGDKEDKPIIKKNDADKTILAVDDTAISLTLLKNNLQGSPYKLICVNSGEEALRFLKNHQPPDLFILDIEMPKMNGYELAVKIRETGQKAPITFLTGNATKRNVLKAIASGASDFIVKPIDKDYLAYKINKYL